MTDPQESTPPQPIAHLDGTGASCATFTPLVADRMRRLQPGQLLEVITDDPSAPDGLPPLGELIGQFVANGGEIWACDACTKPRGITEEDLIPGARIVNAAFVVEQLAGGAATLEW
ncbi:MAG TPA: DsrE family protein [candidate division Zixibacteria bacterium]|nr:DsrE family protein [candidate division Zixibacteria bacterium]